MKRRLLIGVRHADLAIQPRWVISSYNLYYLLIHRIIAEHLTDEALHTTLMAWNKLLLFDMALLIEDYSKGTEETLGPSVELLFPSSQFKQHMTGLLEARERDERVTWTESLALLWLSRGACTVSDLAAVVGLQPNGMTILTDRLSDRGPCHAEAKPNRPARGDGESHVHRS